MFNGRGTITFTTPTNCTKAVMSSRLFSLLQLRGYSTRPHPVIDRIIRVDHAGEYGADRIYAGQMAVLGTHPSAGPVVKVKESQ